MVGWGGTSLMTYSTMCASFLPGTLSAKSVQVGGHTEARRVLTMAFVADHYVVGGLTLIAAQRTLKTLIEDPAVLTARED